MGYTTDVMEEAQYVEPKYTINRDFYHGHYMVIFKDEPNIRYYYGLTKKGKQVKQFCEKDQVLEDGGIELIKKKTKYSEKNCINFLDNR
jgi:hypothetical protein